MWFSNFREYFGMSFVDLLLSEPLNWGKYKLSHAILALSKALLRPATKNTSQKCHFWWRLLSWDMDVSLLPILSPVELGATWCWSIFRPQPGLRAPGDAETTWVSFLLFQPSSWYLTHNFQTSIHYIHYAHMYLLLPPKNGLATLLSVPPVLNGSERLQHVPWQLLLLLPDQWISPKRLTPFMMLSTHCTHCKPPPPPTTAATMIKIIW